MIKIYQNIIRFLVKTAKLQAEEKGNDFNQENSIKKHEAILPIILFYVFIWIFTYFIPSILSIELYLIILLILIMRGVNHYFGWIKIVDKN
ncbi:MAG: hypothetical protein CMG74_03730 [Candidatus Marinimicrobia bacterium]|nr:hypothetical protein [Candidatus Neomarinimicrobiota bacterium]|tara:strand:- start:2016 stop:2288 length:273 start_codon:yes stop_codon:yes gene_type:complete